MGLADVCRIRVVSLDACWLGWRESSRLSEHPPHKKRGEQQARRGTNELKMSSGSASSVSYQWPTDAKAYELISKIGQGAFATVYRAKCLPMSLHKPPSANDRTDAEASTITEEGGRDQYCAIKVLDLEHFDTNLSEIRSEVLTMRLSNHPNVIQFYTSFVYDTNLWLVTELMSKGSSLCCIHAARSVGLLKSGLREEWIAFILHETLQGLQYFHENGQIHRDIKAGNILIGASGEVRLADFGVSGWLISGGLRRDHCKTFVGTPCWMAPEVMEQVTGYDYRADIWSLGITALELAKGYAPYAKYPPMKVLLLTIQQPPPSLDTYDDEKHYNTSNNDYSDVFRDIVRICLVKDPSIRPTCKQVLAHKMFQGYTEALEDHRRKIKEDLLNRIPDVGIEFGNRKPMPGSTPIYANLTEEAHNKQPGISWVFSDGSQVFSSNTSGIDDDLFFDEFERQTGGEAFLALKKQNSETAIIAEADKTINASNKESDKQVEKDEMEDFFDEFEKSTGGEHFRKTQN